MQLDEQNIYKKLLEVTDKDLLFCQKKLLQIFVAGYYCNFLRQLLIDGYAFDLILK